jgi:hypothetical protein
MESYCSLCTLDIYTHTFFVTRLIINQINKVQWVDFKLENVLKNKGAETPKGLRPIDYLRNGELLGHSPILICQIFAL